MKKYLTLFNSHAEYEQYVSGNFEKPNVSHCVQEKDVHYNPMPHDYSKDYLTFVALEDGNVISWKANNSSLTKSISVSTDNGETWTSKTSSTDGTTLATLNTGDKLLVKGTNTAYGSRSNENYYNYFQSTKEFNVQGNIMSLISGDNFRSATTLSETYTFRRLFCQASGLIHAKNLVFPATTVTDNCYDNLFRECINLVSTPPILPAITLTFRCYRSMFYGCTSLTTTPTLPAMTLATLCYNHMFSGCINLTTAPVLPAMTLADYCYTNMFNGCTSLATAPELPATTLVNNCYGYMFQGCTALTTAPELPATTLVESCYQNMFAYCTSLNYIKAMFTTEPSGFYTQNWVNGVASSGAFVKNSAATWTTTGVNGIPTGWTVQTASE